MKRISISVPTSSSEVTESLSHAVAKSRRLARTGLIKSATALLWLNDRLAPKPTCNHSWEEFSGRTVCSTCLAVRKDEYCC